MEKREKREEKSKKGFCTSQKTFEYRKTSENMVLSLEKIEPIVENTGFFNFPVIFSLFLKFEDQVAKFKNDF